MISFTFTLPMGIYMFLLMIRFAINVQKDGESYERKYNWRVTLIVAMFSLGLMAWHTSIIQSQCP